MLNKGSSHTRPWFVLSAKLNSTAAVYTVLYSYLAPPWPQYSQPMRAEQYNLHEPHRPITVFKICYNICYTICYQILYWRIEWLIELSAHAGAKKWTYSDMQNACRTPHHLSQLCCGLRSLDWVIIGTGMNYGPYKSLGPFFFSSARLQQIFLWWVNVALTTGPSIVCALVQVSRKVP